MTRWTCRAALATAAGVLLLVSGVAWAAGLSVSSQRLTAGAVPPPPFHPTGVVVTTFAKGGASPDQRDTITVTFNRPLNATAVCALAPNVLLTGFTATLADGGAGNDTLSVTAGPAACPTPRIGTLDLGTGGYLAGGSATFTASSIQVVTAPPSLQITLGSKPSMNLTDVRGPTVVRFVPHPALTDLAGNLVRGTAGSTVQF